MSFEDVLIKSCDLKQRNLMRPAKVASDKPDTGVTINNKSAYFVIRDCADVTQRYLALLCYASFTDPLKQLAGKFKKIDIIDFVARAHDANNPHTRQLLCVVVADINKCECVPDTTPVVEDDTPINFEELEETQDDIYGDYDYGDHVVETPTVEVTGSDWIHSDLHDDDVLTERLIQAFQAT